MSRISPTLPSRAAPILLLASTTLTCGQPLAPSALAGSYVLESVAIEPIPTVLFSSSDVTIRVLADTLRFHGTGTGTQTGLQVVQSQSSPSLTDTVAVNNQFAFQVVDSRFEITYACPITANCVPGPHLVGQPLADGLRVDHALGDRVPLIYGRLGSRP